MHNMIKKTYLTLSKKWKLAQNHGKVPTKEDISTDKFTWATLHAADLELGSEGVARQSDRCTRLLLDVLNVLPTTTNQTAAQFRGKIKFKPHNLSCRQMNQGVAHAATPATVVGSLTDRTGPDISCSQY